VSYYEVLIDIGLTIWFEDHAPVIEAVDLDEEVLLEPDVPQVFIFVFGRLLVQVFQVIISVLHKRIDGKIPHPESGQVLKEVGPLAGIDLEILQSRFHDQPGP
jgi:hypothetical protein